MACLYKALVNSVVTVDFYLLSTGCQEILFVTLGLKRGARTQPPEFLGLYVGTLVKSPRFLPRGWPGQLRAPKLERRRNNEPDPGNLVEGAMRECHARG